MFSQDGVMRLTRNLVLLAGLLIWAGCESAPAWIPVSDADLKRTNARSPPIRQANLSAAPARRRRPVMADVRSRPKRASGFVQIGV